MKFYSVLAITLVSITCNLALADYFSLRHQQEVQLAEQSKALELARTAARESAISATLHKMATTFASRRGGFASGPEQTRNYEKTSPFSYIGWVHFNFSTVGGDECIASVDDNWVVGYEHKQWTALHCVNSRSGKQTNVLQRLR